MCNFIRREWYTLETMLITKGNKITRWQSKYLTAMASIIVLALEAFCVFSMVTLVAVNSQTPHCDFKYSIDNSTRDVIAKAIPQMAQNMSYSCYYEKLALLGFGLPDFHLPKDVKLNVSKLVYERCKTRRVSVVSSSTRTESTELSASSVESYLQVYKHCALEKLSV
ncbi:hypothetical protein ANCCAN_10992 [Ancylostoma caninum]|uniref:Uncharacterized protein n=1 Tax=Ancylostoma caninum TaxID=29170 RepID=A0A368GF88_ANCCA|nr:hypothetical protein ANCCAN_10992 [Ancylostoma caninum]